MSADWDLQGNTSLTNVRKKKASVRIGRGLLHSQLSLHPLEPSQVVFMLFVVHVPMHLKVKAPVHG